MNRQQINVAFGRTKTLHVVAAAPGFYVVTPCRDEAGAICDASRLPVIAWALDELGITWPVTTRETLSDDNGDPAILAADGCVYDFASTWASLDDWLHDQKAERATHAGKVSI